MASCASACTKRGLAWTMALVLMNEVGGDLGGDFGRHGFGAVVRVAFFSVDSSCKQNTFKLGEDFF